MTELWRGQVGFRAKSFTFAGVRGKVGAKIQARGSFRRRLEHKTSAGPARRSSAENRGRVGPAARSRSRILTLLRRGLFFHLEDLFLTGLLPGLRAPALNPARQFVLPLQLHDGVLLRDFRVGG